MWRSSGIGIVLVCAGVLYLLTEMHVIRFHIDGAVLWSLALLVAGLLGLVNARKRIPVWDICLTGLGLLYTAKYAFHAAALQSVGDWTMVWGVLIIFVGLQMLLPGRWRKRRVHLHVGPDDEVTEIGVDDAKRWKKYAKADKKLIGDVSIGQHPWVLKDMELWNGIGDIRVNLGTARYDEGTYRLDIGGWIGDVRILVPESLATRIEANLGIGDIDVFGDQQGGIRRSVSHEDATFAEAATQLIVQIDLKIGDVAVVRV